MKGDSNSIMRAKGEEWCKECNKMPLEVYRFSFKACSNPSRLNDSVLRILEDN